jgi:hypothetical protein
MSTPATKFQVWDTKPVYLSHLHLCSVENRFDRIAANRSGQLAGCDFAAEHCVVEGCGPANTSLIVGETVDGNGFLQALDFAYNYHRDLVLRPDDMWLLIAMGFATHINKNPEKYRSLLVAFEGKQVIEVEESRVVPGNGVANDWVECGVFDKFGKNIAEHIGAELYDTLVSNFSTTTPLDKAVSEIVLMDTTQACFNFKVVGCCGIPHIILEGTIEDWESLRSRVEPLAAFDLAWWLDDLRPILDQFVDAKRGKVDKDFWARMYRGEHWWGGMYDDVLVDCSVSGWIHALFPYKANKELNKASETTMPASAKYRRMTDSYEKVLGNTCVGCGSVGVGAHGGGQWWCRSCWGLHDLSRWYNHKVSLKDMPTGLRKVPFVWSYCGTQHKCDFVAGFVGCAPTCQANEVRPQLSYCVLRKDQ